MLPQAYRMDTAKEAYYGAVAARLRPAEPRPADGGHHRRGRLFGQVQWLEDRPIEADATQLEPGAVFP